MSTFFTADTVEFSQNVSLYAETAPTPILGINSYDYYLNIYVDDCNLLFLARNYVENQDDRNLVIVNLLPNNVYIYDQINGPHIGIAPVSLTGESYSGTSALIVEVDGVPIVDDDRVIEGGSMIDARRAAMIFFFGRRFGAFFGVPFLLSFMTFGSSAGASSSSGIST